MGASAEGGSRRWDRARRVIAFLVSLIQPGAGHFLLGNLPRGVAWVLGLAVVGVALVFAMPVSPLTIAIGVIVVPLAYVASAVDTLRLTARRRSWKVVLIAWAVLTVGTLGLVEPLQDYYRSRRARAFTIPSGAMEPILLVGDYILTDNSVYRARDPQRGDIIVFKYPADERRNFVKRIIGMPGEEIHIRGRQVIVNGTPLVEPYIKFADSALARASPQASCGYAYGCEATIVPPDSYFVMGDYRDNSLDSRYWGFVKREKITGKAFLIYWSWDGRRQWPRFDRVWRSL